MKQIDEILEMFGLCMYRYAQKTSLNKPMCIFGLKPRDCDAEAGNDILSDVDPN